MNRSTLYAGPVFISLLLLAVVSGCAFHKAVRHDPVTEADALVHKLNRPSEITILDVRDTESYMQGHIMGSVHVDLNEWKHSSLADPTGLDHRSAWEKRIGLLGVSGDDEVIVYDSGQMTDAARIWFILQYCGVRRPSVLNGGYPAVKYLIQRDRIPVSQIASQPAPVDFRPVRGWKPMIGLATRPYVRQAVEGHEVQILDTRSRAEYRGTIRRDNVRAGHLPNAINLPHESLLDERGLLKSSKELATIFERAGFQRGQPVMVYCQSGGRASLTALAAVRAGYGQVLNYYLSFGDWAGHVSCPIVTYGAE